MKRTMITAFAALCGMATGHLVAQPICVSWSSGFAAPPASGLGGGGVNCSCLFDPDGDGPLVPLVVVGGTITNAGPLAVNGIAAWNGAQWQAFGSGLGRVNAVAVFDDGNGPRLHAGWSTGTNPIVCGVSRWTGSAWEQIASLGNREATALGVHDDGTGAKLFLAGRFSLVNGQAADGVACWDGAVWTRWNKGPANSNFGIPMAYDAARAKTVAFSRTETWTWDGFNWDLASASGPSNRLGAVLAYDSLRERTILWGGEEVSPGPQFNETWAWDGSAWTDLVGVGGPAPYRTGAAMAYDAARDRIVVFGGRSSGLRNDTWLFDGTTWTQATPATSPPEMEHGVMAYDAARQRIVLVSGAMNILPANIRTWEWDGVNWTQVATDGPSRRSRAAFVYDSLRERCILYGGIGTGEQRDTWAWDGVQWILLDSGDPLWPSRDSGAAFDPIQDQVVQCRGGRTWIFDSTSWNSPRTGGFLSNDSTPIHAFVSVDHGAGSVLYACGDLHTAGGYPARALATLTDGQWAGVPGLNPVNAAIGSATVFAGQLLLAGNFDCINDCADPADGLVLFNGSTFTAVNGPSEQISGGDPTCVAVSPDGSEFYVGGSFTSVGALPAFGIARWDGSALRPVTIGFINAQQPSHLAVTGAGSSTRVHAMGSFVTAGGYSALGFSFFEATCSPVAITVHPTNQAPNYPTPATFSVQTTGTLPITYQWLRNGIPLTTVPGRIQGSQTATLTISNWSFNDEAEYSVLVTNPVNSATSNTATLTIPGIGPSGPVSVTLLATAPAPLPGQPGSSFTSFGQPVVSRTGEVTLHAGINQAAVFSNLVRFTDGSPALVASHRDQAPGTPAGVRFGFSENSASDCFSDFVVGDNSKVAFKSRLYGTEVTVANRVGIWRYDDESADLVAREGNEAPGTGGAVFSNISSNAFIAVGAEGTVAFSSRLSGAGVTTANNRGLWAWRSGSGATLLARAGSPAAGGSDAFFNVAQFPFVSSVGDVIFFAEAASQTGFNYTTPRDSGLWVFRDDAVSLLVRSGMAAPGFPPDRNIEYVHDGSAVAFPNGDVAFLSNVAGPAGYRSQGLYRTDGSTLTPIVIPGSPAPGAMGTAFGSPSPVATNGRGELLFVSSLAAGSCSSGPCPTRGLWLWDFGETTTVYLNTPPAPAWLPPGYTIDLIEGAAMNSDARIVMQVGSPGGWSGVIGWTRDAGIFPIAVPGMQYEVAEGVYQTVSGASIAAVNGSVTGLRSSSVTEEGKAVLRVTFTNASPSIVEVNFLDLLAASLPCASVVTPDFASVASGQPVELSAFGPQDAASFSWRRNGVTLADGVQPSGSIVSGSQTATLSITGVRPADAGDFDVQTTGECGEVVSSAGKLVVIGCPADFDGNGIREVRDIFAFLSAWFSQSPAADFDGVPGISVPDIFAFLSAWFAGCGT